MFKYYKHVDEFTFAIVVKTESQKNGSVLYPTWYENTFSTNI